MEAVEGEVLEPLSPGAEYVSTSVLSLAIISVLEIQVSFDDSQAMTLLRDVFLPINPRFSSIMVTDRNGDKQWKRAQVRLQNHIHIPDFTPGMPTKFYDDSLDHYLSKIAVEPLPQNQPLWEIHIVKYPTSNAASNIIFKLHHSLGDGFSLMGALFSCLQRADNPSLPLTFPSLQQHTIKNDGKNHSKSRKAPGVFSSLLNTISDFSSSVAKNVIFKDDKSPIRSGHPGAEFLPVAIATLAFSMDHIRLIKTKLGVTVNDVMSGVIFLGTRLYMEKVSPGSGNARTTSLVLLNTRMFGGYKSIKDMVKPDAELPWGNHFAFLSIPLPVFNDADAADPLQFILEAHKIIQKKRRSLAVYMTARYLKLVKKFRGAEVASKCIYDTLENTSIALTNVIGPMEKMALASHPIKGFYFVVAGSPQSIMAGITSYMGILRVALQVEKDFIDAKELKSHIEHAFNLIFKAACTQTPPSTFLSSY